MSTLHLSIICVTCSFIALVLAGALNGRRRPPE